MNRIHRRVIAVAALVVACAAEARTMSFEDRVKGEEAIERLYYAHQVGARTPFDEAVSRAMVEGRVLKYLKESVALKRFWGRSITQGSLQREMERMSRRSQMPERL